jgi:catechol 2,3-dioxygenase-like lactoylglutathione lyase family enzyme
MFDHVGLNVTDKAKSKAFYEKALAPLGYAVVMDFPEGTGFGPEAKPIFWIARRKPVNTGVHVAFHCAKRKTVDAFYDAAIAAGGKDNGKPGIREHYHPSYYGAFVLDPDGNNIEAVCHDPQG